MGTPAATPEFGSSAIGMPDTREAARQVTSLWWLWLVVGICWIVASLVILQFDQASVKTVGVIVGLMFAFAAVQQFVLAAMVDRLRWLWVLFGVLFGAASVICFINPENTFAAIADILGFLFLTVGIWWVIRGFVERGANPVWWLGLISGGLMIILAFWTSGQFFIEKAYTLLVFAGIWAMMQGVGDIIRAFAVRSIGKQL